MAVSVLTTRNWVTLGKAPLVDDDVRGQIAIGGQEVESDNMEPELCLTGNQGAKRINNSKAQRVHEGLVLYLFIHM